ncbi:adenylate cyclase, class 2 [Streptoalloteichus tenebrarius]|uniref:Adenylate cyclase, class 2 n=1 Tax=Streptoalloteichus tenebrarius (strain ATCC 17920 / DSM 40477 / JCM 4838 / CBS 697.72 / NBRC 16177 / NCIMB 11028 / NRRL B-12390 / A12253. 1 / ISP 5477) TaxID=1933 RepID=A0ABT1HQ92_STRSD|nr:class IV adenylate cyclase [Streptoalloteichus tenebrarius]MCP2257678.1 adenylate cyclase, class 2 [Streptoalloteichus tenebrarius]BFE98638.1 hypothetical protein GCM10020241_03140 [Streptoalloteichus tenebrarius]
MGLFEVERKRQLHDADEARALATRLIELGYQQHGRHTETDTYYSRPDVTCLSTVECLRVRRQVSAGFAEITYEPASTGRPGGADARRETTVLLAGAHQADAADRLLTAIGLVPLVVVEKTRTTYWHSAREHVTVTLDSVTGLGMFVGVEVTAADPDSATALLAEAEELLGLADRPVVAPPYRDLVLRAWPPRPPLIPATTVEMIS